MRAFFLHFIIRNCLLPGIALSVALLSACAPEPPKTSPGHLQSPGKAIESIEKNIPPPVQQMPFVPAPKTVRPQELYTVVVDQVPVKELMFALARDAGLNVDIHPGAKGNVTLNAIDQTLPQILKRIAAQVDLRYKLEDDYLSVTPDTPYTQHYQIAYLNLNRDSKHSVTVETQIASTGTTTLNEGGGAGGASGGSSGSNSGNNSSTTITSESQNHFWDSLAEGIKNILAEAKGNMQTVTVNKESGLLSVRASSKQHEEIQKFLDKVLINAQRQVLIEATIAEVRLNDQYQAGVNWQRIAGSFGYVQNMLGGSLGSAGSGQTANPGYTFTYSNPDSKAGDISAVLALLEQFGTVKVLSSPKIMVLNNQTAILKVVDNDVYFTGKVDITEGSNNQFVRSRFETTVHTVPVGLVVSVTPQIADNDAVMLNIRPTISRIISRVKDPNPDLASAGIDSSIPVLRVREIESVLRVTSGNTAIIGGLMEDSTAKDTTGVPVLSDLPMVGDLFSYRDDRYVKTELAIFLRPLVIRDASIDGDLKPYRVFLPQQSEPLVPEANTGLNLNAEMLY